MEDSHLNDVLQKDRIAEIIASLTVAARGCDTGDVLMTEKAAGKNFSCDGTVLYLDCAGAYITMHLPKFTELDTEKENSWYVD